MKENEIRPKALWEDYKKLCEKDSKKIFSNCTTSNITCHSCLCSEASESFEKDGFTYQRCKNCSTIFLNPRPLQKYFEDFYTNGESVKFWCTDFYPTVEEQRKEKIYGPRVDTIKEKLCSLGHKLPIQLVDIGSGYGSFLEEVRERGLCDSPEGIEPSSDLSQICRQKGFNIYESILEKAEGLENKYNVAIAFEVLEHLYNPREFIVKAFELLKPNGILLMTSLSASGYDFQLLGKDHDNLKPPHHINFFTPDSAKRIFTECGFHTVSVDTPGKLDVDILCNRVNDYPHLLDDVLFKSIYDGGDDLKNAFQTYIAKNNLSSHMWIWAIK